MLSLRGHYAFDGMRPYGGAGHTNRLGVFAAIMRGGATRQLRRRNRPYPRSQQAQQGTA